MAFRSTNISIGDAFRTAAAPGQAMADSVDKISLGLMGVVKAHKDAAEKRKEEEERVALGQAAKTGDIASLFNHVKDKDNADLALNLSKVLMTKQAHESELALRAAALTEKNAKDKAKRDFVGKHGLDLLSAIRPDLLVSPEIKTTELVPKVGPDGQPVMENGQPVFETRERLVAPAITEKNPLYEIVQRLKASGAQLTPEMFDDIREENERFTEAAIKLARERGLNQRSAEGATRAGLRGVLDVAKEEQKQDGQLDRDAARHTQRLEAIEARSKEIIEQIEARGSQAKSQQEREHAFDAAQKELDRQLRASLAAAKQGGKPDLADREKAAHIRATRTLIERDRTDKMSAGVKSKGDTAGKAYWRRLGSRGEDFVYEYGASQQDENALFTYLVKTWLTDDLSGSKAIDTSANLPKIKEVLERLQAAKNSNDPKEKRAASMIGSGDAMKRFLDFLREVDAFVDGR